MQRLQGAHSLKDWHYTRQLIDDNNNHSNYSVLAGQSAVVCLLVLIAFIDRFLGIIVAAT